MTIYFQKLASFTVSISSVYLPLYFETMNGRVCGYMVRLLNGRNCSALIPRPSYQYRFTHRFLVLRAVGVGIFF